MIGLKHLKSIATYAITISALILLRLIVFGIISYAQQQSQFSPSIVLGCLKAEDVRKVLSALQTIVLVAIILIVIFILLFNAIGFVSSLAMRIGEFFMERIRFVFELLIIYILFLWQLDPGNVIGPPQSSSGGSSGLECAEVNWNALFSSGPLFFRIVGWIIKGLGIVE